MSVASLLNNRPFPECSKRGKARQCKSSFTSLVRQLDIKSWSRTCTICHESHRKAPCINSQIHRVISIVAVPGEGQGH